MMKKMMLVGAVLLAAVVSQAAPASAYSRGTNSITGLLGFKSSAVNFGVNYEHRLDSGMGLGGYFHYSSEKKDNVGNNQVTSFGGLAPIHFVDDSRVDAYLAPGFGIHMIKGIYGQDDVTTFGPMWKIGALFKIAANVKVGIEQTQLINWFTDKHAGQIDYTNAALNFSF